MKFTTESIDGLQIRYARHTRDGAPTLLLANAWLQSAAAWKPLWGPLGEDYGIVAVDLPGFGHSQGTPETLDPVGAARMLSLLLDRLGVDKVHVLAPSLSVPACLNLALDEPDRVRGVVAIAGPGTVPLDTSPEIKTIINSMGVRRMVAAGGPIFARDGVRRGHVRTEAPAEEVDEALSITADAKVMAARLTMIKHLPTTLAALNERLPDFDLPLLILWGDVDAYFPMSNGERLQEHVDYSQLEIWKGCGHYAHLDDADRFVERIKEWVFGET